MPALLFVINSLFGINEINPFLSAINSGIQGFTGFTPSFTSNFWNYRDIFTEYYQKSQLNSWLFLLNIES